MAKRQIATLSYLISNHLHGLNVWSQLLIGILITLFGLGPLMIYPGVWAAPSQSPTCQTVPPRRPTPSGNDASPSSGESGSPKEGVSSLKTEDALPVFLTQAPSPTHIPAMTVIPFANEPAEEIDSLPISVLGTSQETRTQSNQIDTITQPSPTSSALSFREPGEETDTLVPKEDREDLTMTAEAGEYSLLSEYFILPFGSMLMLIAGLYLLISSRS